MTEKMTGARLNVLWGVGARHALYIYDGHWYISSNASQVLCSTRTAIFCFRPRQNSAIAGTSVSERMSASRSQASPPSRVMCESSARGFGWQQCHPRRCPLMPHSLRGRRCGSTSTDMSAILGLGRGASSTTDRSASCVASTSPNGTAHSWPASFTFIT